MKESDYINDFEIEIYHASKSEMKNFKDFVKFLENEYENAGAVIIRVPESWKREAKSKFVKDNTILTDVRTLNSQEIKTDYGSAYELFCVKKETMKFGKFRDSITPEPNLKIHEKEDLFWSMLISGKILEPYSVDQTISLFPDTCNIMNLNKFTKAHSIIHTKGLQNTTGIHKSYSLTGRSYTAFAFHVEELNLPAINYLHFGEEKIWYIIPHSQLEKLENIARIFGEKVNTTCSNYLRHRSLMIPPMGTFTNTRNSELAEK